MARIYKTTDRIEVKIGEITVKIAPLSLIQKNEIQSMMLEGQKNSDLIKLNAAIHLAVSYCLKEVQGLEDINGNPYQLQSEEGKLTEQCLNELMNMEETPNLLKVCSAFVAGIPKKFDIDGVELVEKKRQATL